MKVNIPREWFEKHVTAEESDDALAGFPGFLAHRSTHGKVPSVPFGSFVSMLRRRENLTLDELAARAEVDVSELQQIEANEEPEPSVVHQLAVAFDLPPKELMRFSGLTSPRSSVAREDAVPYAAHSANVGKLSPDESALLDALIRELNARN